MALFYYRTRYSLVRAKGEVLVLLYVFCSLFCRRFLDNPRADSRQILHAGVLWFRMCLLPFLGLAAPGGDGNKRECRMRMTGLCQCLCQFYWRTCMFFFLITSDNGGGKCDCPRCLSLCLSVSKITQKRVHGFGWHFTCRQVSGHGRTINFWARSGS